jgi:hypothetical protein
MSTVKRSYRGHRRTSRLGAGLLALSTLVAIGISILFLARTGSQHAAPSTAATSSWHSHVTPASVAPAAPDAVFRDPSTHALIRAYVKQCDVAHLRIEKFCALP